MHGLRPLGRSTLPGGRKVHDGQENQLPCGVLVGKQSARLDHLPDGSFEPLNRIGRVNQRTDLRRELKERDHLRSGTLPDVDDGGVLLPHNRVPEVLQSAFCGLGIHGLVDGLELLAYGRPVLVRDERRGCADKVDDTGLMEGLRKDGFNSLRHALQAVRNGDEDVLNTAGLEPVEHARPETRTLVLGDPHAQNLTRTVRSHANPKMNGHVLHGGATADFDSEGIKEGDGVHAFERVILPLADVFKHPVGNRADVIRADAHTVEVVDECLNVAGAHALGVHGDDLLVHLAEGSAVLGYHDRLERVPAVTWNTQRQRTELRFEGLLAEAVALVGGVLTSSALSSSGEGSVAWHPVRWASISPCNMASMRRLEKVRTASEKASAPRGRPEA